jgi:NitT/TauT family transport system substrate-binding protein
MFRRSQVLSLLGGAAAAAFAPARALGQTTKIRIGTQQTEAYAQPYYARDTGIFQQQGLDVEIVPFNNAAISTAALVGGSIDVAGNDVIELANAVNRGIPLVLIAGGALYRSAAPTLLLCVDKNAPIRNAKDFEGQTVAVTVLGGLSYTVTRAWLASNGADLSKIHIIELPPIEMAAALSRGTVAGATISEPSLNVAKATVRPLGKPYDVVANEFQISSWLTSRDWLSRNADTAKRLTVAFYAASRWANAHQSDSLAILEKYTKLNPDNTKGMTRARYATALPLTQLQPLLETALKYKTVERPIDLSKFIATLS